MYIYVEFRGPKPCFSENKLHCSKRCLYLTEKI